MTIGPVQLMVLGFNDPQAHGAIADELKRLRDSDMVRVVDALVVVKDANGETAALEVSQLTGAESAEYGALVGGLVGLGAAGEEGMETGAEAGAEAAASDGFRVFSDQDAWDVMAEIPNGTAAALILLEHRWAIPLRNAIAGAGGFPISDGFIHAQDLVAIGMLEAEEAAELEALTAAKPQQ
jgi:uncharacterized membrane protein